MGFYGVDVYQPIPLHPGIFHTKMVLNLIKPESVFMISSQMPFF